MSAGMELTRLKQRAEFLRIAQKGRKFVVSSHIIQLCRNPAEAERGVRLGFTVTKKLGHAVTRNRIKRRLKEAARLAFPELAKPGYDYVIIGRSKALDCPFADLVRDMRFALTTLASSGKAS